MDQFYLVGIGASAGGLEAITSLVTQIRHLDRPIAYVIVQHLAPDKPSYMKDILLNKVEMPIEIIETGQSLKRDTIYLCPPGKKLAMISGRFVLNDSNDHFGPNKAIDSFFSSLASEFRKRAIAVILSGSGSDGVRGCQEIYESAGEVLVQSPEQAEFASMPDSVIQSGFFSKICDTENIFSEIERMVSDEPSNSNTLMDEISEKISSFASFFLERYHVNIQDYKSATLSRRLAKKMMSLQIHNIDNFIQRLNEDKKLSEDVFNEVMIAVTKFFRDQDFFDSLIKQIVKLNLSAQSEYRVWSVGCSSGEEAYSLLISLLERFEKAQMNIKVKIFATDINQTNLDIASKGFYPKNDLDFISEQLVQKYFEAQDDGYIIKKKYRELVVFSRHDILNSPPFTRIDLTVCRNVLIYLRANAQSRALTNLLFSLNINGILALGPSESVGVLHKYLSVLDRKWRIYSKLKDVDVATNLWRSPKVSSHFSNYADAIHYKLSAHKNALTQILEASYPHSLFINSDDEVIAVFGLGTKTLNKSTSGFLSHDIESIIDSRYSTMIKAGMLECSEESQVIEYENTKLEVDEKDIFVTFCFKKLELASEHFWVVEILKQKDQLQLKKRDMSSDHFVSHSLKLELSYTKDKLNQAVHDLEVTNEELQTSNEELIASNEELQSTNEELNSVNEELYTLNSELQSKIEQVSEVNNDLKNLIEATQIGVVYLDMHCKIRKITHMMQYEFSIRQSDIGRSVFELGFGKFLVDIKDRLIKGLNEHIQFEIKNDDANFFSCSINPYYDQNQTQIGYVITLVDTNEASQREQFLNETQSVAKIGGWVLDLSTSQTRWTHEIYKIYDIDPNTPTNVAQGLAQYSVEDQRIIEENINNCIALKSSFKGVHRFTNTKGNMLWVEVTGEPVENSSGKVISIRGTMQDITEQKLLDERLKLAMHSVGIGVWDWDLLSDIIYWDQKSCEIFHQAKSEWISFKNWFSLISVEDQKEVRDFLNQLQEKEQVVSFQYRIKIADEVRYIKFSGRGYKNNKNQTYKIVGIHQDTTESVLKEMDLQEERKINFHNSKLASLGELAAGIGHEVNNPLAIIMGLKSLLQNKIQANGNMNEEYELVFKRLETACIRIRDIVTGLRVFARAGGDETVAHTVKSIVEGITGLVKGIYDKEGVQLLDHQIDEDLKIRVHFGQIQQVLLNLLSNAKDSLEHQKIKRIEIKVSEVAEKVVIAVIDTGCGIEENKIHKVFESFYTSKPIGKGTGLGLALSKSMVENMGGEIQVESKVGMGTKFSLIFPKASNDQQLKLTEEKLDIDVAKLKQIKALVIDDEPDLVEVFQMTLADLNIQTVGFTNPQQALDYIAKHDVEIIISDIQMPEMNGVELLSKVNDLYANKAKKPICFLLSGDISKVETFDISEKKIPIFSGAISKPFKREELKQILFKELLSKEKV